MAARIYGYLHSYRNRWSGAPVSSPYCVKCAPGMFTRDQISNGLRGEDSLTPILVKAASDRYCSECGVNLRTANGK